MEILAVKFLILSTFEKRHHTTVSDDDKRRREIIRVGSRGHERILETHAPSKVLPLREEEKSVLAREIFVPFLFRERGVKAAEIVGGMYVECNGRHTDIRPYLQNVHLRYYDEEVRESHCSSADFFLIIAHSEHDCPDQPRLCDQASGQKIPQEEFHRVRVLAIRGCQSKHAGHNRPDHCSFPEERGHEESRAWEVGGNEREGWVSEGT